MSVLCRPAVSGDLDDVNVLYQSIQRGVAAFSSRQELIFERIIKEELVDLLVIEKDEFVVGCCHITIVPTLAHGGRSFAMLNHFVIDPLNQQQGLAKKLLEYAVSQARLKGCYQITAVAENIKPWQQKFMSSFGFMEQGGFFVLN